MGKPFSLGMTLGRYQMLHTGHIQMLNKAAELCDTFVVLVGSSQESGTMKNPFSYELRRDMLKEVLGENVGIYPLPDAGLGNVAAWGRYVLDHFYEYLGAYPDLVVSGSEARRTDWFGANEEIKPAELFVPKIINISGTEMREMLIYDRENEWRSYTDPRLWHRYGELRRLVLESMNNSETASI